MTSECIEVWYCSNSALVLVIIGINWILEGQRKYRKEAFLTLVWPLDTLICTKKLFSNSEPLSYMEARVRHINVCSKFCPRSRGKYGFLGFFWKKKSFLLRHQLTSHFFALLNDWKVASSGKAQLCQVWCRSEKTSRFPNIHWQVSRNVF